MSMSSASRQSFMALSLHGTRCFRAGSSEPDREHTDYNEGFVLPMAIERRTYVAGAVNGSAKCE